MVSKKYWKRLQLKIRKLNLKVLLVLFLIGIFTTLIALRSNNVQMLRLREAVFIADESGEGVNEALDELRTYVHNHMNTDLNSGGISIKPPIQLKFTYERLVAAEEQKVKAHNEKVVAEAPGICERRFPAGQIRPRAECVDEYIAENTKKASTTIPKELYQFDFVSPRWSPDFAGFMLLITFGLGIVLIARIILGLLIAYEVNR